MSCSRCVNDGPDIYIGCPDCGQTREAWENNRVVEDMVNHPAHYQLLDGVEVLDVIKATLTEEQLKGYFIGNCIKYLCRANKKNGDEDLAKMEFYVKELMDG